MEAYIFFLVKNAQFRTAQVNSEGGKNLYCGASYEANIRGLDCTEESIAEALECQKKIRSILDDKCFKIIARWIKKAKEDGRINIASMLHAHLAYLFRNVQVEDLDPTKVFSILASQIFLFSNFKYDIDLDMKETKSGHRTRKSLDEDIKDDLRIPQVELFDTFQLNRGKIMKWLLADADNRNAVISWSVSFFNILFLPHKA